MEKQVVLSFMVQYNQQKARINKLNGPSLSDEEARNGYWNLCGEGEAIDALDALDALEDIIHTHFHQLFDNYFLREYLKEAIEYSGPDIALGKNYHPNDVMEFYTELKEIDQKMENRELIYITHTKTEVDYWCCQIWLAEPSLYEEYEKRYEIASEKEAGHRRYIPPELTILAPFLAEYEEDERLIEIWSGPF